MSWLANKYMHAGSRVEPGVCHSMGTYTISDICALPVPVDLAGHNLTSISHQVN
jgi:hypothetical protein